jgi:hypothetical protein
MTNDAPLIPAAIWTRIVAWLKAGGSGEITLQAHRGHVRDAWIRERITADGSNEPDRMTR